MLEQDNVDRIAGVGDESHSPVSEPQWEHPVGPGVVTAFMRTVSSVLLRPVPTFSAMTTSSNIGRPFTFAVLAMLGATLLGAVVAGSAGRGAASAGLLFFVTVASLAIAVPLLFVEALVYHVLLMVLGGDRRGFAATFRVCAYVDGSTAMIGWVPVIGPLIALTWGVYLRIVGIREIHETSTAHAFWSVFLAFVVPLLMAIGLIGGLVTLAYFLFSGDPAPAIEV